MENRLSIKLCQKNLLTEQKYAGLGVYSSISYVRRESQDIFPRLLALAAGAFTEPQGFPRI